jgi:hypothetical protein
MLKGLLILVLMLLIAACGGADVADNDDGGGSGGDRDFDRCSIMSAEEAAQWLGSPVVVGPSDVPVGAENTCRYRNDAAEMQVLIQIYDGEKYWAFPGSATRGPTDIADLGEDAHADGDSVSFLKNEFAASVSRIQGDIPAEDLEAIARLLEPRLP